MADTFVGTSNFGNTNITGKLAVTEKIEAKDGSIAESSKEVVTGGQLYTVKTALEAADSTLGGRVTAVETYVTADGINANSKKITNVADGDISSAASKEAVNGGQLYTAQTTLQTGIDELDYRLGGESGGPETGEAVLWLGDSGAGKSQCLVNIGINAARQGFRVAHFQLEGTKEQCLNRYDAAWTGTLYQDVKLGNITAKKMEVTKRIIKKLKRTDIIVSSEETFNAKTILDVRRELKEMEKKYGNIDVIIIDYLELLELGDGHLYAPSEERFRQAKLAKGMKMLAMEFNAVVHTATQSSNIPEEQKNDPEFVITRSQLSEDKGKIRPMDIFVTINQTRDESRDEIMRLHTDKLRDYKNGNPIHICNNFAYARFYDRKRTMELNMEDGWGEFYDDKEEKE